MRVWDLSIYVDVIQARIPKFQSKGEMVKQPKILKYKKQIEGDRIAEELQNGNKSVERTDN